MLVLKVVVLYTELNSASNGDIFKEGHRAKEGDLAKGEGDSVIVKVRVS